MTDQSLPAVTGDFICNLPKAELHLHIEGTLEPNVLLEIALRNKLKTKHNTIESLHQAYQFGNLQDFLDIYYEGAAVLLHEQDFYDLTMAYLERAHFEENILHAEIFFDPQTHTSRGVPFEVVINGITRAMNDARTNHGMSVSLIMCFLRHLSQEDALETLEQAMPFRDLILGVGLDSSELGNPPSKFERVFEKARDAGFRLMAHAGEEGPPDYIQDSLNLLHASRIDHGIRCLEDPKLVKRLEKEQIPLTTCPLSNLKLCVISDLRNFPLRRMMDAGLLATINSDDPAYFGGYLNANYRAVTDALALTIEDLRLLAKNGFQASFAREEEKKCWMQQVDDYCDSYLSQIH